MTIPESGTPIFDEGEVARILRRTAELQARQRGRTSTGLTLEELRQLAAESGLDPLLVSAAVSEIRTGSDASARTWWGGPLEFNLEHAFEGRIGRDTWERMIERIRRALGQEGEIEERGSTREWVRRVRDGNGGRVSIQESGGRTTILIYWRVAMPAVLLYMAHAVVSLLTLPALLAAFGPGLWPFLPVWLATVAALFMATRWQVGRITDRERRRATTLLGDLVAMASRQESTGVRERIGPQELDSTSTTGRIHLEDPADPGSPEDATGTRVRGRGR